MSRRISLLLCLALVLVLRAGEVARKAEDYPAKMDFRDVTMAAENLGPSVPTPSGGMLTRDYMSIDVALFPRNLNRDALIDHSQFGLRINGAMVLLRPDSPSAVAASIKYPDWERRGQWEARGGMGGADVILGRPRAVERFPGDHRPAEQQGAGPVPRIENPLGKQGEPASIEELVARAALPEGVVTLPVSGCLYFPFKGKLKSIKKLELVYAGPFGEGSVRIP